MPKAQASSKLRFLAICVFFRKQIKCELHLSGLRVVIVRCETETLRGVFAIRNFQFKNIVHTSTNGQIAKVHQQVRNSLRLKMNDLRTLRLSKKLGIRITE